MKKLIAAALLFGGITFGFSQSVYYDQYRNDISSVDWGRMATDYHLTTEQVNQINALNNQYADYNSWNSVYGTRPTEWRRDRDERLRTILGTDNYTRWNKQRFANGHDNRPATKNRKNIKNTRYYKAKAKGDGSHLYMRGKKK